MALDFQDVAAEYVEAQARRNNDAISKAVIEMIAQEQPRCGVLASMDRNGVVEARLDETVAYGTVAYTQTPLSTEELFL